MEADQSNNYLYNKHLKPYAKKLRFDMTKAEACMWKYVLKARKMQGYPFRRQRPVLNYIVDFMCKELKLVIEVDGITHSYAKVAARDEKRDAALKTAGFTVLRFTDEEVLNSIEQVYRTIEAWIEQYAIVPPPGPRQRGKAS